MIDSEKYINIVKEYIHAEYYSDKPSYEFYARQEAIEIIRLLINAKNEEEEDV